MNWRGDPYDQDICTLANRLGKTNDTRYPIKEKVQDGNWGMRIIWSWILSVYGGWIPDDANKGDLPRYTRELTLNQSFFALPSAERSLFGVGVKDSAGNWRKLKKITLEEMQDRGYDEPEFENTPGVPTYYRPLANGFKIYPQSDTTIASGLGVDIAREHTDFTTSTTDTAPGFDYAFHEAVAVFMALQHCQIDGKEKRAARLQKQWDGNQESTGVEGGYKKAVKEHYKMKFRENNPPQVKRDRSYVDEMS